MNISSNAENMFQILLIPKTKVFQLVLTQSSAVVFVGVFHLFFFFQFYLFIFGCVGSSLLHAGFL